MAFDSDPKRIELKIPKEMFRNLEIIAGVCGESVEKHIARLISDEQRLCVIWSRVDDAVPEGFVPIGWPYLLDEESYRYLKGECAVQQ